MAHKEACMREEHTNESLQGSRQAARVATANQSAMQWAEND